MQFLDDSLHPENMEKVVITVAPYGPEWMPADFPEDIPVTMEEQIQKAVDCYNAGATLLHLHVRVPETGHGSKDFAHYNQQLERLRCYKRQHHPGIGAESTAEQVQPERDHQNRGQLEAAQLCDRLEQRMQ